MYTYIFSTGFHFDIYIFSEFQVLILLLLLLFFIYYRLLLLLLRIIIIILLWFDTFYYKYLPSLFCNRFVPITRAWLIWSMTINYSYIYIHTVQHEILSSSYSH